MSYRLSREADEDIARIYVEGAHLFGRAQAETCHRQLKSFFELLAANPRMARGTDGDFTAGAYPSVQGSPHRLSIRGNEALSAPAIHRQIWLQGAGLSLEMQGYEPESQADIQKAIEAMIEPLGMSYRSFQPDRLPGKRMLNPPER